MERKKMNGNALYDNSITRGVQTALSFRNDVYYKMAKPCKIKSDTFIHTIVTHTRFPTHSGSDAFILYEPNNYHRKIIYN